MKYIFKQVWIEFKLHLREPEAILWGVFFPVVMIAVLGFIFGGKMEGNDKGVLALSSHPSLNEFSTRLSNEGFTVKRLPNDEMQKVLNKSEVDAAVYLSRKEGVSEYILQHGMMSPAVQKAKDDIESVFLKWNIEVLSNQGISAPANLVFQEAISTDKTGKPVPYSIWLVPGMIMYNLFMGCVFGIGIMVVREKQRGKFKKIATTPLPKSQYILVQAVERMMVMSLEAMILFLVGWLLFKAVPVSSVFWIVTATVFSMMVFLVFGFAIASVSKTTEKAVALTNVFFIGSTILSGVYFSTAKFPLFLKAISYTLPATLSIELLRGLFTYGQTALELWPQWTGLAAWMLLSMLISVVFFKWNED